MTKPSLKVLFEMTAERYATLIKEADLDIDLSDCKTVEDVNEKFSKDFVMVHVAGPCIFPKALRENHILLVPDGFSYPDEAMWREIFLILLGDKLISATIPDTFGPED